MKTHVYADFSNLVYTGRHLAAVQSGAAASFAESQRRKLADPTFRVDLLPLGDIITGGVFGNLYAVGSFTAANDNQSRAVAIGPWTLDLFFRAAGRREKGVDMHLGLRIRDDLDRMRAGEDEVTIVAGDADYLPLVKRVQAAGIRVVVAFWAEGLARSLREAADEYYDLTPHFELLSLRR